MLSGKLTALRDAIQSLAERKLAHLTAEDVTIDGRHITLGGRRLVHFGSCSYVGLETDARLKRGACEAVDRYGVQFASSRVYLECPLYDELESLLERMFGSHVVVAQTTSLAHFSALPVLVGPSDAVIFDQFVHASAQAVGPTLREMGATCLLVRHDDLVALEQKIGELRARHRRIWYVADGVYSMAGNLASMAALREMLERHEQLHLYIDDSHGTSWTGIHGRGMALDERPLHPRMVVVLSLAKAFSASGAAMVFPDRDMAKLVRTCGSTMIFSGPLQPSLLGAAVASARVHLSDDLVELQSRLGERIALFNSLAREADLLLATPAATPIRFVRIGSEADAMDIGECLMSEGYFANVAVHPAVPKRRAGIRVALTVHQTLDDVRDIVGVLSSLCRRARQKGIRSEPNGPLLR
jgi:7-keto-8-aminopelargonate synthetase-like enzyme